MAKKRALVDAVLNATASSDIFTQDMEEETNRDVPEENRNQSEQSEPPVSAKQIDFIEQLLSAKRIGIEQARMELQKRYRTIDYKQLTRKQASEFIKVLQEYKGISA